MESGHKTKEAVNFRLYEMPLRRRRRGRRREKERSLEEEASEKPKEENKEAEEGNKVEGTPPEAKAASDGDRSMDDEERKARETIALLAKKYQVRIAGESSNSLDIIRVDEAEVAQYEAVAGKENRRHPVSPLSSRPRPRPIALKRVKLQKPPSKQSNGKSRDGTPSSVFKVPKPLANHSTPAPSGDRSLFGFEELDSPLTLSPVTTTPAAATRGLSLSMVAQYNGSLGEEEGGSKSVKPSPYSRLKGTYDIPFKKKTPRRQPGRRRKSTNGEERWADKLNAQFSEIEEFELAVE